MTYAALRKDESVGRPVGSKDWREDMETRSGLTLAPSKLGRRQNLIRGFVYMSP